MSQLPPTGNLRLLDWVSRVTPRTDAPRCLDSVRDPQRLLVLPHTDDQPPLRSQRPIVADIPLPIRLELLSPPAGVRLGLDRVVGTAMPEAAVDLHRYASTGEHNVGTTRQAFHVHSKSQSPSVEFPADGKLRLGAGGPLPGHEGGHLRAGCRRSIAGRKLRGHSYKHDPKATGAKAELSTCGASEGIGALPRESL